MLFFYKTFLWGVKLISVKPNLLCLLPKENTKEEKSMRAYTYFIGVAKTCLENARKFQSVGDVTFFVKAIGINLEKAKPCVGAELEDIGTNEIELSKLIDAGLSAIRSTNNKMHVEYKEGIARQKIFEYENFGMAGLISKSL